MGTNLAVKKISDHTFDTELLFNLSMIGVIQFQLIAGDLFEDLMHEVQRKMGIENESTNELRYSGQAFEMVEFFYQKCNDNKEMLVSHEDLINAKEKESWDNLYKSALIARTVLQNKYQIDIFNHLSSKELALLVSLLETLTASGKVQELDLLMDQLSLFQDDLEKEEIDEEEKQRKIEQQVVENFLEVITSNNTVKAIEMLNGEQSHILKNAQPGSIMMNIIGGSHWEAAHYCLENNLDTEGMPAQAYCAMIRSGHEQLIKLAFEKQNDFSRINLQMPPLLNDVIEVARENLNVVPTLIKSGFNFSEDIIKKLIKNDVEIEFIELLLKEGQSVESFLSSDDLFKFERVDILKLLISYNLDVNEKIRGKSLIETALEKNNIPFMRGSSFF